MHPVIAQRQVVRQHEAGFADPASVQVERRREIVDLRVSRCERSRLRAPATPRPADRGLRAPRMSSACRPGPGWSAAGRATSARVRAAIRAAVAFRLVSGGDAERCQHCYQCAFRDADSATAPILVVGGDPESTRKFDQRRRQFGSYRHLACRDVLDATRVFTSASSCSVSWVCSGPYDAQRRFLLFLPPNQWQVTGTVAQTTTGVYANGGRVQTFTWRGRLGCPTVIPVNRGTRQHSGVRSAGSMSKNGR